MDTNTIVTDGVLAGTSTFTASQIIANSSPSLDANSQTTILLSIITGIVVPFLKEALIAWRDKRRERKKKINKPTV